jgi:hypothetical protein
MPSNELETMPRLHATKGNTHVDVSNSDQANSNPSLAARASRREYAADPVIVSAREAVKTVRVSAGKRRKVIQSQSSTSFALRRTRFGGTKSLRQRLPGSTAPIYNTVEEIKEETKAARQKQLHETFEKHDNKVRELFHLTKFVNLVGYDVETAKEDESEVFKEVSLLSFFCQSNFLKVQGTLRTLGEGGGCEDWWTSSFNTTCYLHPKGRSRACLGSTTISENLIIGPCSRTDQEISR